MIVFMANMRSFAGIFTFVILLASLDGGGRLVGASRVIKVGGQLGWREPEANQSQVYSTWAATHRFQVNDSLRFIYQSDSVMQVEKWGYYHCNASQPVIAFDNGNSTFKLDRPGPFYYISGNHGHCKKGQRLFVEVMGYHYQHHPGHYSPPYVASPPSNYFPQAPTPQYQPSSSGGGGANPMTSLHLVSLVFNVVVCMAVSF